MGSNPKSHLSPGQIIQKCYDADEDQIRVKAQYNATLSGELEIALDASEDSVAIKSSTTGNELQPNSDGSINVTATFPPNSSVQITDGVDTLEINSDGSINTVISATDLDIRNLNSSQDNVAISDGIDTLAINNDGSINITDNGNSITVDGTVSVNQNGTWDINNISGTVSLPTGAATSANQTTANASLASIDSKLTSPITITGTVIADAGIGTFQTNVTNTGGASAVNIQDGGNSITVDGTVAATQSGSWTTGRTWNLSDSTDIIKVEGGNTTAVKIDGSAITQPISGSISVNNFPVIQDINIVSSVELEIKNDSGNPISISAASLPLPIGAATSANQTTANTSLASIDSKLTSPLTVNSQGEEQSGSYPDPSSYDLGTFSTLLKDGFGNLQIRGPVITDELSFRDDFSGSSLTSALTGTLTFTNNNTNISGIGTSFTTEVKSGQYIKKTADAESLYIQIDYIVDDTNLVLVSNYTGTTSTTTAVISNYKTTVSGGTLTVSNSILSITAPNGNNNSAMIDRQGDFLPYNIEFQANVNQRVNNQTSIVGFQDNVTTPTKQAVIVFDGTVNTQIRFRTSSSSAAADIEETVVTLPSSGISSNNHIYKIDLSGNQATLLVNDVILATHRTHIPGPYDVLRLMAKISNSTVGTGSGTLALDYFWFSNNDRLETSNNFRGEPDRVQLQGYVSSTGLSQDITSDGSNRLNVLAAIADGSKASYSASIVDLASATLATDIFTITGSSTKTVRITRLEISGTQTTASIVNILLVKRSTANTGGTVTNPSKVAHDSQNAAATATISAYTANPTTGNLIGQIRTAKIFVSTTRTLGELIVMDFGDRPSQAIVLRGTSEVLALNLNGVTVAGANFDIAIEWTEE